MNRNDGARSDVRKAREAATGATNYRLWWEQAEHRRAEVEEVLDLVLGTNEDDGAGQGLAADVLLAIQKAWDEGYGDDLTCNDPRSNPYREATR